MNDLFDVAIMQAQTPGFEQVFTALSGQAGVIALSIFIIYAGAKGWWVWGYQHKERVKDLNDRLDEAESRHTVREAALLEERNEWQKVAMTGLRAAEKAILQAEVRRGGHAGTDTTPQGK